MTSVGRRAERTARASDRSPLPDSGAASAADVADSGRPAGRRKAGWLVGGPQPRCSIIVTEKYRKYVTRTDRESLPDDTAAGNCVSVNIDVGRRTIDMCFQLLVRRTAAHAYKRRNTEIMITSLISHCNDKTFDHSELPPKTP